MGSLQASISVKPPGEGWTMIGAGHAPGIYPESISFDKALPGGAQSMQFKLQRDTRVAWPDLLAGSRVHLAVGGLPVWSGQIVETSRARGGAAVWDVSCKGYIRHAQEDDTVDKLFVSRDLSKWIDNKTTNTASGNTFTDAYVVSQDRYLRVGIPHGTTVGNGTAGGFVFDAGPNNTIKRIVLTYVGGGHATVGSLYVVSNADGYSSTEAYTLDAAPLATTPTTVAQTFTTARRYVEVGITNGSGASATLAAATAWCVVTSIILVSDTAYESGNESALTASTVLTWLVGTSGAMPLINTSDTSQIATTSTILPEFATDGYESPAAIIDKVNAVDGYQWFFTNDRTPSLVYRAVPSTPSWVIRTADEVDLSGADNLSDIYNRVRVRWVDTAGIETTTTVTPTTDTTLPGRMGFYRTADLEIRRPTTSTAATAIGNAFLAAYGKAPAKGTVKLRGTVDHINGGSYPVAALPIGDGLLLSRENNPDTGGRGRMGIVSALAYNHDDQTMTVTLDNARTLFDQQLARFESTGRFR